MWEVHALVPGFRIRCKLDFALHGTFWAAAPFAVPALRAKVSGSRKATELRKVASLGQPQLLRSLTKSIKEAQQAQLTHELTR